MDSYPFYPVHVRISRRFSDFKLKLEPNNSNSYAFVRTLGHTVCIWSWIGQNHYRINERDKLIWLWNKLTIDFVWGNNVCRNFSLNWAEIIKILNSPIDTLNKRLRNIVFCCIFLSYRFHNSIIDIDMKIELMKKFNNMEFRQGDPTFSHK